MSDGHRDRYHLVVTVTDGGIKGKEAARMTPSNGVNGRGPFWISFRCL